MSLLYYNPVEMKWLSFKPMADFDLILHDSYFSAVLDDSHVFFRVLYDDHFFLPKFYKIANFTIKISIEKSC